MQASDDIELFLLALVSRGLATPYDFKVQAGLSVGSTAPVLARLEEHGWIGGGKPGVRGSRRFTITKTGEKTLAAEWRGLLRRRSTSIDEILRVVYLAWALGEISSAAQFMDQASTDLIALATTRKAEAAHLQSLLYGKAAGEAYRWLKLRTQVAELEANARMLKEMKKELEKQKKAKKRA